MTISMARWASAAAIGLLIALSGQGRAEAQSVMKVCADEYSQAKASGATNGETWQQFLQHCKTQQADAAAAPAPAPVAQPPAAPAPATTASSSSVYKQCQADWSQAKANGATQGQSWQQYLAGCKARREAAAAQPRPWWMPAPAPASTATAPAAPAPQPTATATGAGEFTTAAQAKGRCPFDMVVWVNTKSSIYHYEGAHRYANTLHGAYMCEADAKATGHRAAANEKRPTA
jgi:hypothetical protein